MPDSVRPSGIPRLSSSPAVLPTVPASPAASTPSKVPVKSSPSSIPKRKTRVANLISRLSSSTASSRAKRESRLLDEAVAKGSPTPDSQRNSRLAPIMSTSSQLTLAGPDKKRRSQLFGRLGSPPSTGHQRSESELSESSVFFPKVNASPPPKASVTSNGSQPGAVATTARAASSSMNMNRQLQQQRLRKPETVRSVSSPANATTPTPSAKPRRPEPLTLSATNGKSAVERPRSWNRPGSRTGSRPPSRIVVKRPGSRVSMRPESISSVVSTASTTMAGARYSRVEELKSKIGELEQVLKNERNERESVMLWVDQVRTLETQLQMERSEKEALYERLKEDEDGGHETGSETGDMHISHASLSSIEDDTRHKRLSSIQRSRASFYETRIVELEAKIKQLGSGQRKGSVDSNMPTPPPSENEEDRRLLELQTEINFLKGDNAALRKEKDYYQAQFKAKDKAAKMQATKLQTVQEKLHGLQSKSDSAIYGLSEQRERVSTLEKQLHMKSTSLTAATAEVESLKADCASLKARLAETSQTLEHTSQSLAEEVQHVADMKADLERTSTERDEYRRQVQGFLASQRHHDKTVAGLERDNRRARRLVNALETSLQDLKISLEEKAMENDELNRSILKVMEQANETIEGAKRHSVYLSSPPMKRDSMGFDVASPASLVRTFPSPSGTPPLQSSRESYADSHESMSSIER